MDISPQEKIGRPTINPPTPLIIAFSAASIGILSTYTVLGSFGTRQIGYTMGHRCNDLGGRHELSPQSATLHINFHCKE